MVLIISNTYDKSTSLVVDWLKVRGVDVCIINEDDEVILEFINIFKPIESIINVNGKQIKIGDITSFWFRKGGIKLKFDNTNYINNSSELIGHIYREWVVVEKAILDFFSKVNRIGDPHLCELNKLSVLEQASEIGINVPSTYIVSKKENLIDLCKKHQRLVIKPFSNLFGYSSNDSFLIQYTNSIIESDCREFPDFFFPLFVQEEINIYFEVRIVAIKGSLYPTAIIPYDSKTTDIRKLKVEDKRFVPIKLPNSLSKKLTELLSKNSCTFGCIDMIITPDFKYYFLEINPQGQYGAFAYYSGYKLDREIAKVLAHQK